jgi:lipopolysaccharide transport system ATP-binding protein
MTAPSVIHTESLGKNYRRGLQQTPGLRHALEDFARNPLKSLRRPTQETFWALKDVSVDVHEGEVLGLIGRNGAGKTTLLKILSRITRPTTGFAEIHGRVGSLLEVGTGFHPELTGRENAFLSGAILGMRKRDITRKFDEIVAFAEIEKFIDTPVKHYSSGMYVRLAFAVAAHLEPEILLVDEVLAVGDINFQKKCLGKMGDVARAGRTVVLVSHQLNQIRRLCHRVVWVDDGSVRAEGPAAAVVTEYETAMGSGVQSDKNSGRAPALKACFLSWEIAGAENQSPHTLGHAGPLTVRFSLRVSQALSGLHHGIALYDGNRQLIWSYARNEAEVGPGDYFFSHSLPGLPIKPGSYSWLVSLYEEGEPLDVWEAEPEMLVAAPPVSHPRDEWAGILNIPSELSISAR